MNKIQTVTGPVAKHALGITLIHEHINYTAFGEVGDYDTQLISDNATHDLLEFAGVGGRTFVDATPIGNGRLPKVMAEVSRRSGINVIASTGFYARAKLMELVGTEDVDAIAELMISEIRSGIEGTDIRAGIIKLGSSAQFSDDERRVFLAGAKAQKATNAGIITHTHYGALALEQADLLIGEGVDPRRIVVGHMVDRPDPEIFLGIARKGANVGIDRVGKKSKPEDKTVEAMVAVIKAGYAKHFVLSSDASMHRAGKRLKRVAVGEAGEPTPEGKTKPRTTYIALTFLKKLRDKGIREEDIADFQVGNPARVLAGD